MIKCIIFGAGGTGSTIIKSLHSDKNRKVVAFLDNDKKKWGNSLFDQIIYNPEDILRLEYDEIIIGTIMSPDEVKIQLVNLGVQINAINSKYVDRIHNARLSWLKDFALFVSCKNADFALAEAGVFYGDFAKEINRLFQNRKLYLFDTFEGFDIKDLVYENEDFYKTSGNLSMTSEELVINKMPYPHNVDIRKGYFPQSTEGITDRFIFVNLDMDLFKPTYEGLKFFYPKMIKGGIILIHDYFSEVYGESIKRAISMFESDIKHKLNLFPIGDETSIAVLIVN